MRTGTCAIPLRRVFFLGHLLCFVWNRRLSSLANSVFLEFAVIRTEIRHFLVSVRRKKGFIAVKKLKLVRIHPTLGGICFSGLLIVFCWGFLSGHGFRVNGGGESPTIIKDSTLSRYLPGITLYKTVLRTNEVDYPLVDVIVAVVPGSGTRILHSPLFSHRGGPFWSLFEAVKVPDTGAREIFARRLAHLLTYLIPKGGLKGIPGPGSGNGGFSYVLTQSSESIRKVEVKFNAGGQFLGLSLKYTE